MRTIERSTAFNHDFKHLKKTARHSKDLNPLVFDVVKLLLEDQPLPKSKKDHPLKGDWKGYRECHISPDLLLIYRKSNSETLRLARLGTHSELFSK